MNLFDDFEDFKDDDQFVDDPELEDEQDEAESRDDDISVNPYFIGTAMGFAYEEGLRTRKRKKSKRFSDDGP